LKKYLVLILIIACATVLVSWGPAGHRAVALIAENHLTPATKLAIKKLLGNSTLADVSNWADDIRSDPQYKYTGVWHYVNVSPGLTFAQFSKVVINMRHENVYKAVVQFERDLQDPAKSRYEKGIALKFLVHFIGDLHQPMHVSNGEHKGGNTIAVKFDGENSNLHELWDSGLIYKQGLSYKQMAVDYDTATPAEIKKWQSDDLMLWLWESYQVSSILYKEAADNPDFGDDYYKAHLPVLKKQIEKGGIRLAGVLNSIFAGSK
jgi:hypothetical protein